MLTFVLRRLVLSVVVLFVACSASFCFFATQYEPLRGTPLQHAYWQWLRGLATGRSYTHGIVFGPFGGQVVHSLERTLALLALTLVFVVLFASLLGCLAAATRGSALDLLLRTGSYVAWAVPAFLLGLVLQQTLGKIAGGPGLGLFPPAGWAGQCPGGLGIDLHTFRCPAAGTGIVFVGHVLYHLTLPAVALAGGFVGLHGRYLRASLVESLAAPYVTVARAKGLPERSVLFRHAMRNSLIAFVPAVLTDFGAIFGASLAVDWVFRLGGLGGLFVGTLNVQSTSPVLDTYAVEVLLLVGGAGVLLASLLGELAIGFLDPRVRLG